MSDFSLNSLYGRSAGGVSGLDYTNMKNKLYSTRITSLLGSVKKTNSVFSPAFLLQINDSKLVTPKIINNYLKKADEAYGTKIEEDSKRVRHKTFVDEILEKANTKEPDTETEESVVEGGEAETESDISSESPYVHYGIVGEILDKYS